MAGSSTATRSLAAAREILGPRDSKTTSGGNINYAVNPDADAQLNELFEERAAIMEYCGGMNQIEAQKLARIDVFQKGFNSAKTKTRGI